MTVGLRAVALLVGSMPLAACEPQPLAPPDVEPLTGFEPTEDFVVSSGVGGTRAEIQALVGQPRAAMRAYAVGSAAEIGEVLEGLGLTRGPTAVVEDAEGRAYQVVGTSAGTFLFDMSSFVTL